MFLFIILTYGLLKVNVFVIYRDRLAVVEQNVLMIFHNPFKRFEFVICFQ